MITLDEAEKLAMETDYAVKAVGEQINTADAGAFFFEGYKHAESELKNLACEFAEWIEKDYMAIDPKNWKKLGDTVSVIYSAKQLFAKFLEERGGNVCCRCGELGATEKHGMCKKCIDFCQTK